MGNQRGRRQGQTGGDFYLAANHDMSNFGFAVTAVSLIVSRSNRQNKVSRVTLALPHQEAAILSFLCQQFLSLPA